MVVRSDAARTLLFGLGLTLAACGSKTGLDTPEAGIDAGHDAGYDAGVDAGPPPVPCIEVPPELGAVSASFDIPASLAVVDIMFLIDATGSMRDEIDAVRNGLRGRVVPGVRAAIPDAAFGVAFFGEFPVEPHGPASVSPYEIRSPITVDTPRVEAAFEFPPNWGNRDDPEAAIEGLHQVTVGSGYGTSTTPGYIPASVGCPTGGVGGACFRPEALPIVMLITDAPMHNGPPGVDPVDNYLFSPPPHGYRETVDAVTRLGILVVGLGASDAGRPSPAPHLRQLARDTMSVDGSGAPLYFDIGTRGDLIGAEIVRSVQFVASEVPLEVVAAIEDMPGDDVDATALVSAVLADRADPPGNVERREGDTFYGVLPGTVLTYRVVLDASGLEPSPERREFPARIIFRAVGGGRLDVRELLIVVPGEDGIGCEDM